MPGVPYNQEAEMSVLGSILMKNDLMEECTDVKDADFHSPEHRAIYSAMLELYNQNKPIDLVTLREKVGKKASMDTVLAISEIFAPASTFKHHKGILLDNAVKRRIIQIGQGLIEKIDTYANTDELLDKAETAILGIRQKTANSFIKLGDKLPDIWEEIHKRKEKPGENSGLSTGFTDIDLKLGGLHGGKLYYIAARPAMGKTSLVLQMCSNVAAQNIPVLFFSLEMTLNEVISRIISQDTMTPNDDLKFGTVSDERMEDIKQYMNKVYSYPLVIDDTGGMTIWQMRTIAKKVKKAFGGLGLIAIDYLQYMGGKSENRRILIENNSAGLKMIAKELNVPVVCLSQLSRAPEGRDNQRPVLSDLRETGAIEQDADVAAFLYRDEYYNLDSADKHLAEFIIRKNRDGQLGTVKLGWIGNCTAFLNYTQLEKIRKEDGKHDGKKA